MVQPGHSLAGHVPDAWGTFSPDIIECTGAITKSICANVLLVAGGLQYHIGRGREDAVLQDDAVAWDPQKSHTGEDTTNRTARTLE